MFILAALLTVLAVVSFFVGFFLNYPWSSPFYNAYIEEERIKHSYLMSKCSCNYHLGMGPNLKCPSHGGKYL
jgi:hypothetical protein